MQRGRQYWLYRESTFGNPELDSENPLSINCRSQGGSFNHVAHTQNRAWQISTLHQHSEIKTHFMVVEIYTVQIYFSDSICP